MPTRGACIREEGYGGVSVKYAAYPSYKPSGVEWLGDMPGHWEVKRLKYGATINDEALPETTDPNFEFTYVDISSVDASAGIVAKEQMVFEDAPSRARRIVSDGDTIVSTVRTYLRAIAPIRKPEDNLIVSTGFAVVRPRSAEPSYLSYALRESGFVETVVARSVGVSYPAVNASDVGTIPVPLPQAIEQRAIADFLDRETAKLDTLVDKKRELIEKLKEKRAALISRTVTRGLPPDAARAAGLEPNPKFKPSGIAWLGEVPVNWEVTRLKNVIKGGLANGLFKTKEYFGSGTRLINVYDAYREEFLVDEESLERVEATPSELNTYRVQSGDILFVRSSLKVEGIGRAVCCLSPAEDLVFECHLVRARPRLERITPAFLITFLNSCFGIHWLISQANTVTMATLGQTKIMDLPVLVPPRVEQGAIADYLDRETAKIDRMAEKVEQAIARLQEYRTALITAAVTGKIDVRGVIAHSASTQSASAVKVSA